jgi:hypothetical protein
VSSWCGTALCGPFAAEGVTRGLKPRGRRDAGNKPEGVTGDAEGEAKPVLARRVAL